MAYSLEQFVLPYMAIVIKGNLWGRQSVILSVEARPDVTDKSALAWTALPVLISENNMTQPASPAQSQSIRFAGES